MPTPRETILAALNARLSALPATALRGEVLPKRVPAEGLLILRDGEPGEPEVTLSPLACHHQHRAEVEAVVQRVDRDAAFDTLTASVGSAVAADRTLGGLCDWVEAEAPRPVDLPVAGAASLKAAVIPAVLHYTRADQLVYARDRRRDEWLSFWRVQPVSRTGAAIRPRACISREHGRNHDGLPR
ncbi:hypothetical protein SAMN05421539_12336 [Jannaschia seohaensis]|uniref:Acyl-CoA transferase n=1 Tax=Jannaschia seohaensis TaxID=475081 RepID=A0A2Y9B6J4_9RHOB|nr:hypothetical protein BCF38_12336 [Jannaschia seohaensis]SSA51685.1 hypothetical protein SAMN05421539_12336 [Jannaschia seohaensis]